jgi:hypothetical protein
MAAAIQRVAKTVDQMNELPFSEKQVLYYCFTLPLLYFTTDFFCVFVIN